MKKTILLAAALILFVQNSVIAQDKENSQVSQTQIAEFIHWYPALEQVKMRDLWLKDFKPGEWRFTGMAGADDRTVITVQADVNYGYSWFNISNEPIVITIPKYSKYYSLSIFDMNHFMEVLIKPEKPVVIRLPHQKSPIEGATEIVLQTYQGLAFTRQVIVNNEEEVMNIAKKITIEGGGGGFPFTVPEFTKEEEKAGMTEISKYLESENATTEKFFGSVYEGIGDLDRAAGVLIGQLGTQARYAKYGLYFTDDRKETFNSTDSYEITIPGSGLIKNKDGYWSLTVYNADDKYLIHNKQNKYHISSYSANQNADGTYTIRVNPKGEGNNAVPTSGKKWYAVFRVYEPIDGIEFPEFEKK